ncbi:MAG: MFS transporter [Oscillospiraceae bacterium]|nr:MFS transporter [Oscillospiraceae bacterium]
MKLDYKRTLFVGLAFMSICSFWQVYDGIVPLILKNTFQIGDFWAGWVMAADNVLALFMLPLFGALSDKTRSRFGRRMPFIVGGTILACTAMLVLPFADAIVSLPLFFVGLGVVLFAMSTYRSPAVALMPDVTMKPLRSKANAVINLMGAIGGIIMLGAIPLLVSKTGKPNYFPLYLFTIAIMAVCVLVLVWKINEPKCVEQMHADSLAAGIDTAAEKQKSPDAPKQKLPRDVFISLCFILASVFFWFMGYNAVTTAFSKYANIAWGMQGGNYALVLLVAQAAAIVSYLPVGMLASKIGRKKTILLGIVMLAVSFSSAMFFKSFSAMIFFFFALAGIGWAFINVNSYPMVVEMSNGADVGKYTGYYYTFSMLAQTITPICSGALLQFFGYHTLFPYGAFFVALSFVTMLFVRHGDSRPTQTKSIEAFGSEE